uniref:SJCHGC03180 protein n=1 Tax=Schistosoma japonicum TaxID=6182 RepID=Q5D9J0_SCHJA|nr:SJCHGC03180 protein [Schistosoma japonicum]
MNDRQTLNDVFFVFISACQEHITEVACVTKESGKPDCDWCEDCQTCVLKESPCSCLDQTETTESQPQKTGSSNIYYIVGIVSACIFIGLFIVGMIVWRYKIPNHQFNCQPCMTQIGETLH